MTGACDAALYGEDADLGRNVARIPELVDSINIQATGLAHAFRAIDVAATDYFDL